MVSNYKRMKILSSDLKACELYDVVGREPNGSVAIRSREQKEERHSEFLRKQYMRFGRYWMFKMFTSCLNFYWDSGKLFENRLGKKRFILDMTGIILFIYSLQI